MSTPLRSSRYASLSTFRRSGVEVRTPIWFAADPEDAALLWMYTNGLSGKVKRIRNNPRARVAPCTASGRVLGDWAEGRVRLFTRADAEFALGMRLLRARYGLLFAAFQFASCLVRSHRHLLVLCVRLENP